MGNCVSPMRMAQALVLFQLAFCSMSAFSQVPDLSGTWLSVPELGAPLDAAALPLTPAAQSKLDAFDPKRLDSTYFCMPFGTPRNTLNTAERPLQVIQTGTQLTLLFDGLGDVRRVFLDGRPHPEDPIPSWMGHAVGTWNDSTLEIDTIAMTSESILTEQGLPHSESMQLTEQLRLVEQGGETLLQLDMQISDPEYYQAPLTATRYFRRAPGAQLSEGSSQCLLDQWRRRLEELNRAMYRDLQAATAEQNQ
jgi:hypothetical protein